VFEYRTFKRPGDSLAALLIITLTVPVWFMALIGLVVQNQGKVFFQQERPGLNGKIFKILKFKTMTDERDENGKLLTDSARLTYFGQIVDQWIFLGSRIN
jgi:undecaprenyl phosphate N,N'-diacetylbacillosamine 1-phosphate transferase